jgi:hypothetical protein
LVDAEACVTIVAICVVKSAPAAPAMMMSLPMSPLVKAAVAEVTVVDAAVELPRR